MMPSIGCIARNGGLTAAAICLAAAAAQAQPIKSFGAVQEVFKNSCALQTCHSTVAHQGNLVLEHEDLSYASLVDQPSFHPEAKAVDLLRVRSADPGPPERLEREELFAKIRDLLAELAPADRDILTLRYALDYDANQIAEMLDVNVTAVHMRLSRARQRLADRLTALGVRPGP